MGLLTWLNWANLDTAAPTTKDWVVVAASVAALLLIRRDLRAGLWLATALGVGFFVFATTSDLGPQTLAERPVLLSTLALVATGVVMLWYTRERSQSKQAQYERHSRF